MAKRSLNKKMRMIQIRIVFFLMRVYRYTEINDIYFRFNLHLLYILVDCVPHT